MLNNVTLREDSNRPGTYHAVLSGVPMGPVRLNLLGDRIKELQPDNGDYTVILRSGARLPLSRGYRDKLQERITARTA